VPGGTGRVSGPQIGGVQFSSPVWRQTLAKIIKFMTGNDKTKLIARFKRTVHGSGASWVPMDDEGHY
jgi:hypothetical protein